MTVHDDVMMLMVIGGGRVEWTGVWLISAPADACSFERVQILVNAVAAGAC